MVISWTYTKTVTKSQNTPSTYTYCVLHIRAIIPVPIKVTQRLHIYSGRAWFWSPSCFWFSSVESVLIFAHLFASTETEEPNFSLFTTFYLPYTHATSINPLKPELNPICYLLALLAQHFLRVSRIRVKSLTLRLLMSYIRSTYSWCF